MYVAQAKTRKRKTSQAESVIASRPKPLGWNTTDEGDRASPLARRNRTDVGTASGISISLFWRVLRAIHSAKQLSR